MNRILLVDDDRHSSAALAATLRILGYTVDAALDGAEAEKCVEELNPDVAIVDLNLPGISGMEIINRLSTRPQPIHCCLATGMADFGLLKGALAAGAWTLMGKPFELLHLNAVLQAAATMIAARRLSQTVRENLPQGMLMITRRGDTPVNSEDIARIMRFAAQSGADDEVSRRRIPIVAYELLSNARTFGALQSSEHNYRLLIQDSDSAIQLFVADGGQGFAWKRELSRARTRWDKSKASGLQLISALAEGIEYSDNEFTASVAISKVARPIPAEHLVPFAANR